MELIVLLNDFAINSFIIIAIIAKLIKCFFVPFSRNKRFIKQFIYLFFSESLYIIIAIIKNNISLSRVNLLSAIKP